MSSRNRKVTRYWWDFGSQPNGQHARRADDAGRGRCARSEGDDAMNWTDEDERIPKELQERKQRYEFAPQIREVLEPFDKEFKS